MKKGILVFALLLVGMLAFGQPTLTGTIETGFKVVNDATGTKVQQFDWNQGYPGWGQVVLNATSGNTSADIYLKVTDYATLTAPYMWVTEKFGGLTLRVGSIYTCTFATAYNGIGGIDLQGVQAVYKLGPLSVGGSVPLTNVLTDVSSLTKFKAGASLDLGPVNILASYYNATLPVITGSLSGTFGKLWTGVEVQNTSGSPIIISPYADLMILNDKVELTLDSWTDTADIVKNSETEFWVNYWPVSTFRLMGRVNYVGTGYFKTREGFRLDTSKKDWIRVQLDTSWTASPTHTLNAMFVHTL